MTVFTVAAAQYPIDRLADWDAYVAKLTRWVEEAVGQGARLLVFPEYGAMELASLDPASMGDLAGSIDTVSALLPEVDALHMALAGRHGVYILAASAPRRAEGGAVLNTARLFAPNGGVGAQDKLIMTRFEREEWFVRGGEQLTVLDTELGRLAITICYDSEFPLLARAAVEAGAEVLLVPSCTDTLHGYWRVRIGSQARALEGQCFVVQSPTVGEAAWSPAVDVNRGAAGVYGPPDAAPAGGGMPADGVIALGEEGASGWVYATIDTARVAAMRADGGVLPVAHWSEQPGAVPLPPVRQVVLR